MLDAHGREIRYLRVSVTDRCDLRCRYCTPEDIDKLPMEGIMTYEEIALVCRAAAGLGITAFKITGGEPFARRGLGRLLLMLREIDGAGDITVTTNGTMLAANIGALLDAGITHVNVSLDTLDRAVYKRICGRDRLLDVLDGIDTACKHGLKVKLNAVLCAGINEDAWRELVPFAQTRAVDLRFIELMPIGHGREFVGVSNVALEAAIVEAFGEPDGRPTGLGNGPAAYIHLPGFKGNIGFISPLNKNFCARCDRMRLTSVGKLKPCLCYGDTVDLMDVLRSDARDKVRQIEARFRQAASLKPLRHCFDDIKTVTEHNGMSAIGG